MCLAGVCVPQTHAFLVERLQAQQDELQRHQRETVQLNTELRGLLDRVSGGGAVGLNVKRVSSIQNLGLWRVCWHEGVLAFEAYAAQHRAAGPAGQGERGGGLWVLIFKLGPQSRTWACGVYVC
jgi:hypothetical protein